MNNTKTFFKKSLIVPETIVLLWFYGTCICICICVCVCLHIYIYKLWIYGLYPKYHFYLDVEVSFSYIFIILIWKVDHDNFLKEYFKIKEISHTILYKHIKIFLPSAPCVLTVPFRKAMHLNLASVVKNFESI